MPDIHCDYLCVSWLIANSTHRKSDAYCLHTDASICCNTFAYLCTYVRWISTISPGFQSHLCTIVADSTHVRCTTLICLIIV